MPSKPEELVAIAYLEKFIKECEQFAFSSNGLSRERFLWSKYCRSLIDNYNLAKVNYDLSLPTWADVLLLTYDTVEVIRGRFPDE